MPATDRNQTAIYLPMNGYGDDGQPTFNVLAWQEIKVRWIDTDVLVPRPTSELTKIIAMVTVGIDVTIGSLMWLGSLADAADAYVADGQLLDVCEVVSFKKTPDIKARTFFRRVGLQKYKGSATLGVVIF